MKKIKVKVDVSKGIITVKRGLFGRKYTFKGEWYTDASINDMVEEFCKQEVEDFSKMLSKNIK